MKRIAIAIGVAAFAIGVIGIVVENNVLADGLRTMQTDNLDIIYAHKTRMCLAEDGYLTIREEDSKIVCAVPTLAKYTDLMNVENEFYNEY